VLGQTVNLRPIGNILKDRFRERVRFLEHHAYATAQFRNIYIRCIDILAVQCYDTGYPTGYCQLNDIQSAQPIDGFIPLLSGHDLGARHLMPFTKCSRAKLAIVNRSSQVPSQSEQISYHAINRKKALSLSS
jgi:hypothetical protein